MMLEGVKELDILLTELEEFKIVVGEDDSSKSDFTFKKIQFESHKKIKEGKEGKETPKKSKSTESLDILSPSPSKELIVNDNKNTNTKTGETIKANESSIDDILNSLANELSQFTTSSSTPLKEKTPTQRNNPTISQKSFAEKRTLKDIVGNIDSGYICILCTEKIMGKVIKINEDKVYHPNHFKCQFQKTKGNPQSACGKQLNLFNFKEKEGILYCQVCFVEAFCEKCAYCLLPIKDKLIHALGLAFHSHHFFCAQCGKLFESDGEIKYMEYDGQAYCEEDYLALFADKCAACHKKIIGNHLKVADKSYHTECLKCSVCEKVFGLNQPVFIHDKKPVCEYHYYEKLDSICSTCNKAIVGKFVKAIGKKFHEGCFECSYCRKDLNSNPFTENQGKPYCQSCGLKLFG